MNFVLYLLGGKIMSVVEIKKPKNKVLESTCTFEELVQEYDAYICLCIINDLSQLGLLSEEEYQKVKEKIAQKYTPYLL